MIYWIQQRRNPHERIGRAGDGAHSGAGDDDRRDADGSGVLECSGTGFSVPD